MRAQILGLETGFDVTLEQQADGSMEPPAFVTLSLRPCWRKPPVRMRVGYLYSDEAAGVAYYDVVEEL